MYLCLTNCLDTLEQYVDLSKLRKISLKRYKKHFNLDVKADSKTELLEAVARHFAQMPVSETDVALEFYNFLRNLRGKRVPNSDPSSMDHSPPATTSPSPPATASPSPPAATAQPTPSQQPHAAASASGR